MKRTIVVGLLATAVLAGAVRAQEEDKPVDPRILAYDKGPAKIDVSKYSPEMQKIYNNIFSKKCGIKCHKLARPINCEFALEDEWERYIKRMTRKAGSFISADEGKQIYEFLVYDSKIRKKALYDKKKAEAPKT